MYPEDSDKIDPVMPLSRGLVALVLLPLPSFKNVYKFCSLASFTKRKHLSAPSNVAALTVSSWKQSSDSSKLDAKSGDRAWSNLSMFNDERRIFDESMTLTDDLLDFVLVDSGVPPSSMSCETCRKGPICADDGIVDCCYLIVSVTATTNKKGRQSWR
jgi:hypothetical protein